MPVILEDEVMNRRNLQRALVFRFDEFAYSRALRAVLPIHPVFADRLFFVMPAKDEVPVDLFARLPEVGLPGEQHNPAWQAIQCISRFLMKDLTLLTIVRGQPINGSINLGYHASEPYDVVERCIEERIGVARLSDLARARRQAATTIDNSATLQTMLESMESSTLSKEMKSELPTYLQGKTAWKPLFDTRECVEFLAAHVGPDPLVWNDIERRAAQAMQNVLGLYKWIMTHSNSPLLNTFESALEFLVLEAGWSEDRVLAALICLEGCKPSSSAWWWLVEQLVDSGRFVKVLKSLPTPLNGVSGLCTFATTAKDDLPVVVHAVRTVCEADPAWRALAKRML